MNIKFKKLPLAFVVAGFCLPGTSVADDDFMFSGYARLGSGYTELNDKGDQESGLDVINGQAIIKTAGSPYRATGRLGNESMGYEFGLTQKFQKDSSRWNFSFMMEDYSEDIDDPSFKQGFAGGYGLFEAQPDVYIWGGKRFNDRHHWGLSDEYIIRNDGTGGGVDDLNLNFAKFNLAYVSGDDGSSKSGNSDRKAITSRLHGINLGDIGELSLGLTYGFSSKEGAKDAYQASAKFSKWFDGGSFHAISRYGHNARTSVLFGNGLDREEDTSALVFALKGQQWIINGVELAYSLIHEIDETEAYTEDPYKWTQGIVRPSYQWTSTMSTWLEVAYDQVEFGEAGTNSSWKTTLSQNVALNWGMSSRPIVRAYATYGELDTDVINNTSSPEGNSDALTVGLMFEAWWGGDMTRH